MSTSNETKNYHFNMIIIKPNTLVEGKYNYFNENIYTVLNHDESFGPILDTDHAINKLNEYLSKKDFFETFKINFENMLFLIESFFNPNKTNEHSFQVKTCLDNNNELIMFIFDAKNKNINQYNHIASILGPQIESICGPVFITKILKNNNQVLKHIDIELSDITKIWFNLKQTTYWNFLDKKWTKHNMFNNNKQFNNQADKWSFAHIEKSIVFYKFRNNESMPVDDVKIYLLKNLNDADVLDVIFENIKICKLKTGEYVNESINYNTELASVNNEIGTSAVNGFKNYNKYQVLMESIFQNVDTLSFV